jgi:hypothetical protein
VGGMSKGVLGRATHHHDTIVPYLLIIIRVPALGITTPLMLLFLHVPIS